MKIETVAMAKDGKMAVVNESDVKAWTKDGWKKATKAQTEKVEKKK